MQIKKVKISDINPAKYNPRKDLQPGDPEYEKIKRSIEEFDCVEPLVLNKRGNVLVGGHQRLKVLKERGDIEVECSIVDLEPAKEKALNIALNKISGEWDFPKLKDLLEEIDTGEFDIEITGFDLGEIEDIMTQWGEPKGGLTDDDEIPEVEEAVTKRGDLWLLGKHRVLCGDATVKADVARLMGEKRAILMVTDPPYGVKYDPEWRDEADKKGILGNRYPTRALGKIKNDDKIDWSDAYVLFEGDICYVWHAGRHASEVQASIEKSGFVIICQIIWGKPHFALSRGDYHWQHEPCWYAVRKGKKHNWQGRRDQATLWNIAGMNAMGASQDKADNTTGHGTQKPVLCMQKPIENNSSVGDIIYDPFLGSGTTLIATEKTNRICYGMEIDEHYCDVIVKRWENYTGKKGKLEK